MTIYPLYCGTYSVGLDKQFHPIERNANADKGALKLSINPFLIRTDDHNIIIDPGLGEFGVGTSQLEMHRQLHEYGLSEYDITDIICSHLHYDHIGGLAHRNSGYWELSFPEARVWVSEQEWDKAMRLDIYYDEEKTEFLSFVNARANMNFLAAKDHPIEGIRTELMGGHTEFSQLILGDFDGGAFLMAGDVLASRSHVNRKFKAKYDFDPDRAADLRVELAKKAYDEGRWILAFHSNTGPVFKLAEYDAKNGYTLVDLNELEVGRHA
jgi:glyoxylase-like metal-dependent hydrolase (beta-lactamase superfamily II)